MHSMAAAPQTIPTTLRFGRIVWSVLLASQLLYSFGLNRLIHQLSIGHPVPPNAFVIGMNCTAIFELAFGIFAYVRLVGRSCRTLASNPSDARALLRWRQGMILTCVMAETVVMTGFALRVQGALPTQSFPTIAVGIGAMLLFYPKAPTN